MLILIVFHGQMTELMVHNVIKEAKKRGFERVIFPSMDAYDDVGQREYLSRGLGIGRVERSIYGDLDTKGKLILQSSPEFKTKANIESGFNAGTGSVFVSSITNQFDISKFKHVFLKI